MPRAKHDPWRGAVLARTLLATLALSAAALPAQAAPAPFTGRCVAIIDGDTLEVLRGQTTERVRLEGIDAPERGQPFSTKARDHLSDLAFGRELLVHPQGKDQFDRWIARVNVAGADPSRPDLSEAMVAAGLAWHFVRYSSDETLARLEREARSAARGLWVETRPMPPWTWREIGRERSRRSSPGGSTGPYHGNRGSRVFHQATCHHYHCKNCVVEFATREAALEAGYRPCGTCRP